MEQRPFNKFSTTIASSGGKLNGKFHLLTLKDLRYNILNDLNNCLKNKKKKIQALVLPC